MILFDLNYILILSDDEAVIEILSRVSRRLGAKKVLCCPRPSKALSELERSVIPDLVIEDMKSIEEESFFPVLEEHEICLRYDRRKKAQAKQARKVQPQVILPTPAFAVLSPQFESDIKKIQASNYIGYDIQPLNENILEQKIRSIFYESFSYDDSGALNELVEQHIARNHYKLAYCDLLPALRRSSFELNYLILYARILVSWEKYRLAENILQFILNVDPDNFTAKNMMSKIYLITERYQDGEKL